MEDIENQQATTPKDSLLTTGKIMETIGKLVEVVLTAIGSVANIHIDYDAKKYENNWRRIIIMVFSGVISILIFNFIFSILFLSGVSMGVAVSIGLLISSCICLLMTSAIFYKTIDEQ